jgi:hypothetical protein
MWVTRPRRGAGCTDRRRRRKARHAVARRKAAAARPMSARVGRRRRISARRSSVRSPIGGGALGAGPRRRGHPVAAGLPRAVVWWVGGECGNGHP